MNEFLGQRRRRRDRPENRLGNQLSKHFDSAVRPGPIQNLAGNLHILTWLFSDHNCHRAVTPGDVTVAKSNLS